MKPFLLLVLTAGLTFPVQAENIDPKILCIRNQVKFDLERESYIKYVAFEYERDKKNWKNTTNEWLNLGEAWGNAAKAERRASIPILKLAGYEKPDYYLKLRELSRKEVINRWGYTPFVTNPEYKKAWNYFSRTSGSNGPKSRDALCKLYGVEFDWRYDDLQRLSDRYNK